MPRPKKIQDTETLPNEVDAVREEAASYEHGIDQEESTQIDLIRQQLQRLTLESDRYKDDTTMRKILVFIFTGIIAGWLIFVMAIVSNNFTEPRLTEKVLITLLTTTTVTVIGMMHIILKNLFPSADRPLKSQKAAAGVKRTKKIP